MKLLNSLLHWLGRQLARYLSARRHVCSAAPVVSAHSLLAHLQPADVLLVEGNSRISTAIKYLTQSTWSHAALYVGGYLSESGNPTGHCFVEADTLEGVRSIGVNEFQGLHVRICRPVGLAVGEREKVVRYAIDRIGHQYDLRNVIDLARYLLPTPPVPLMMRRRMLSLGSGDPTRAICSTLIAQAFQSIRYPILPITHLHRSESPDCPGCIQEILQVRHHSLFTPRDFDVSPYFAVIKPSLSEGFDFHALKWRLTTDPEMSSNDSTSA